MAARAVNSRRYVRLAEGVTTHQGLKEAVAETGDLPLEQCNL
jgi:hypothetical protein